MGAVASFADNVGAADVVGEVAGANGAAAGTSANFTVGCRRSFLETSWATLRTFAGEDVAEQAGIVELVEEPLDRRDVESVLVVAPKNLVPGDRRAVKETLRRDHHPFAAVVERNRASTNVRRSLRPTRR